MTIIFNDLIIVTFYLQINLIWSCIIFHIFIYTTMLIIFYMFSTELTKLSFGEVLTNSFNTGVTGNVGGGAGAPGISTTDIMRTGISSNNNNNVNRHSFMQQQPVHHHYHHLSDDIITNNAAVAVAVATATLAVGGGGGGVDGANAIQNVGREGSKK